jgi:hypothetical protein
MVAKPDQILPERVIIPMGRKLIQEIEDFSYARRIPSRADILGTISSDASLPAGATAERRVELDAARPGSGSAHSLP